MYKHFVVLVIVGSLVASCAARKTLHNKQLVQSNVVHMDSIAASTTSKLVANIDTTIVVAEDSLEYELDIPGTIPTDSTIHTLLQTKAGGKLATFAIHKGKLKAKIKLPAIHIPVRSSFTHETTVALTAQNKYDSAATVQTTTKANETKKAPTAVRIIKSVVLLACFIAIGYILYTIQTTIK
ncbi:MAG: hypothetical protein RL660_439 [Bacteroidota bacterium]